MILGFLPIEETLLTHVKIKTFQAPVSAKNYLISITFLKLY